MPTITAGSTATETLVSAQSILITCDPAEVVLFQVLRSGVLVAGGQARSSQVVGPFSVGDVITLTAQRGQADYTLVAYTRDVGLAALSYDLATLQAGGFAFALGEQAPVQTLTATGTAFTGVGEYGGFTVRAIVGASQTVTVYDATSATGTPIHTEVVSATGYFPWAGNKLRPLTTGCHVTISGGTSRTLDIIAG